MASKKGVAITAIIAAAIVGSSFLIWIIPQSSPSSMIDLPPDDNGNISDVYSRHQTRATTIESNFEQWKSGEVTAGDMLSQVNRDRSDVQNMRQQLDSASPAQEWQQSYDFYIQALDSFLKYLDTMQTIIVENNVTQDSNLKLDALKQEWQGYVDSSVNAMPIQLRTYRTESLLAFVLNVLVFNAVFEATKPAARSFSINLSTDSVFDLSFDEISSARK